MTATIHDRAAALRQALAKVNELAIPVVCRDRGISLTEQARLTRQLFTQLGLKHISVTVPRYANAIAVQVCIPFFQDCRPDCSFRTRDLCNTCHENDKMCRKLKEILARAFPQHDDRSDPWTDYFDAPFVVSLSER